MVGHVLKLSRANEGKVSRVEKENRPFAFYILRRNCFEFAVVKCFYFEVRDCFVDHRHKIAPTRLIAHKWIGQIRSLFRAAWLKTQSMCASIICKND
jgi:hypothetical protein